MARTALSALTGLLLVSCAQTPSTLVSSGFNSAQPASRATARPLNALQRLALKKMDAGLYDGAILTLQRALNIEPRNPVNWYYLARNYQLKGDLEHCREMIRRSRAYGRLDAELERKNLSLLEQCQ